MFFTIFDCEAPLDVGAKWFRGNVSGFCRNWEVDIGISFWAM